jgi:hypothetical protein
VLSDPTKMSNGDILLGLCFLPSLFPFFLKGRSGWDKFSIFWYTFTTIIHFLFDSSYTYLCWADEKGVNGSDNFFAEIWRGYGMFNVVYIVICLWFIV